VSVAQVAHDVIAIANLYGRMLKAVGYARPRLDHDLADAQRRTGALRAGDGFIYLPEKTTTSTPTSKETP
jgi:hypothetical protein